MSFNLGIAIFNTVLLPDVEYRLAIEGVSEEEQSRIKADEGNVILLALTDDKPRGSLTEEDLCPLGVAAEIIELTEGPMGTFMHARTREKVRVSGIHITEGFIEAEAEPVEELMDITYAGEQELLEKIKKITIDIAAQIRGGESAIEYVRKLKSVNEFAAVFCQFFDMTPEEKYALLETDSFRERCLRVYAALLRFKGTVDLQTDLNNADDPEGKAYKKAAIQKQMKLLERELKEIEPGEDDDEDSFEKRIAAAGMPADVRKEVERVLKHFNQEPTNGAEYNSLYNYLDFVTSLSWKIGEQKKIDLKRARRIMDRDHYGLEKVKERILQHLAVMALGEQRAEEAEKREKLSSESEKEVKASAGKAVGKKQKTKISPGQKGTILLLVGPPGTGKTSMGRSIAEALGREYVRISLGGIRDEAEIRGHRRTYIGAMPGRIMSGIKRCGAMDPVVVLDEVDKLQQSFNGDPSAALLEVLDPEQNMTFEDHYLDVPYDLSHAVFICTANTWDTIPQPLLDRMEVIELSGYTPTEHFHIAKEHLVPLALEETGLRKKDLRFTDGALRKIISEYTMEAGVRGLKKQLLTVCRKAAVRMLETEETKEKAGLGTDDRTVSTAGNKAGSKNAGTIVVKESNVEDFLGRKKIRHDKILKDNPAGVVTGLAWTQAGGEILFIETAAMNGSGRVHLTGHIGDVMKESAETAVSLVKSTFMESGLDFSTKDIHIHIPEGAVPKDGPSAGITMFTAVTSLALGIPVSPYLAMTGEISLRGKVLPIGGLPEKLMAAERAGIQKVMIPKENERDLEDVPSEILQSIEVIPVETVAEVVSLALQTELPERSANPFAVQSQRSGSVDGDDEA